VPENVFTYIRNKWRNLTYLSTCHI